MSKRQTTLVKFQNRKPNPTKTQIVVYCVKKWVVEKTEKLQNKSTADSLQGIARSTKKAQGGVCQ
jgi:hypothetical protein